MSGKPSKKDFADLINSVVGQEIMTEQKLDRILRDAKKANETKGPEGLFDYLRQITNAPVSNDQIRGIAEMVKKSGGPEQALETLKKQKLLNEQQASKIDKSLNKKPRKRRRGH